MKMQPPPPASQVAEWDAALTRRMEARLAESMREIIESESDSESA